MRKFSKTRKIGLRVTAGTMNLPILREEISLTDESTVVLGDSPVEPEDSSKFPHMFFTKNDHTWWSFLFLYVFVSVIV